MFIFLCYTRTAERIALVLVLVLMFVVLLTSLYNRASNQCYYVKHGAGCDMGKVGGSKKTKRGILIFTVR